MRLEIVKLQYNNSLVFTFHFDRTAGHLAQPTLTGHRLTSDLSLEQSTQSLGIPTSASSAYHIHKNSVVSEMVLATPAIALLA